jgi:hypothetical protein
MHEILRITRFLFMGSISFGICMRLNKLSSSRSSAVSLQGVPRLSLTEAVYLNLSNHDTVSRNSTPTPAMRSSSSASVSVQKLQKSDHMSWFLVVLILAGT